MRMLKTNHGTVSVQPTSRHCMCEIAHNLKVEELRARGSHGVLVVDVKLRRH
jgi:hypothetical protein